MDFIIMCFDVVWFWLGRIIGGLFCLAFVVAIAVSIVDYCFNKLNNIKLFVEFLNWKRNQ